MLHVSQIVSYAMALKSEDEDFGNLDVYRQITCLQVDCSCQCWCKFLFSNITKGISTKFPASDTDIL